MSSSRGVIPQDAVNINEILRSQGVVEYNPEIITQLLEFSYRYTSELLSDADDYRENAGRTLVSKKDVDLAIAIQGKLLQHSQPSQADLDIQALLINNASLQQVPGKGGVLLPTSNKLLSDNYDVCISKKAKQ